MRLFKEVILYVSFFGMLGFAALSYILFTKPNNAPMTGSAVTGVAGTQKAAIGDPTTSPMAATPTTGAAPVATAEPEVPVVQATEVAGDLTGFKRASNIMGINTADIKEDTSAIQFVDLFRSAIPFYETTPWGSGKDVVYDDNGWPTDLKGGQALTKFLNRLPAKTVPDGFYTVLFDGKGTIHYGNDAALVAHRDGMDIIEIKAGKDGILNASLVIKETDATDYIRNIRVLLPGGICNGNPYIRVDDATECQPGQYMSFAEHHEAIRYNPEYLNFVKDFQVIRFMNMSGMTRNPVQKWEDRHNMDEATWGGREGTYSRGAPAEIMVDIANRVNADAWFSMPYQADDDYVRNFAKLVNEQLKPGLKAYIEYSNEIWNPIFVHHDYAMNQGLKLGLDKDKNRAREKFHSYRSVQVFDIWEEEFGGTDRLVRVMGAWTSNPRMSNAILSYRDAFEKTDALAIAPYFGATVKEIQRAKNVDDIFDAINDKNSKKGFAASVRQMQQQAKVAEVFNVDLIAYEGGQHLVDWNTRKADDGNNELLYKANRDHRMGDLYKDYLKAWEKAGGKMFVQFSAPRIFSWYGSWGIKEYISQSRSEAPKYDAILSYMEEKVGIESPESIKTKMNTSTARNGVSITKVTSPDQIWSLDNYWPIYAATKDSSKPTSVAAKWQAHYDENNLYLSISVNDGHVEIGDGVEVVIEAEGQRNELSIMYSDKVLSNTLFTKIDSGYHITTVIPWEDVKGAPAEAEEETAKLEVKKATVTSKASDDEEEVVKKVVPEVGSSIYFDIKISDVDKSREKKPLFFADRVDSKAGDRELIQSVVSSAKKLGHKEEEIQNHLKQIELVE
ncbi:hypothetical protein EOL70_05960 [Leucothrix sargassi]|nr:hypothetical protein EOL70_05960 [Leucothrix sargassi]